MTSALPGVLAEIADVAGADAAWALAQAYGGTTIYIPAYPKDGHWLSELVGPESAEQICAHFRVNRGGARLLVPLARLGQQQSRLNRALDTDASATEAARISGLHERTVWRTKKRRKERQHQKDDKRRRPDDRQKKLF